MYVNRPEYESKDLKGDTNHPQVKSLTLKDPLEQPAVGSLAAVRFFEDGLVFRAKVSIRQFAFTATFWPGGGHPR